MRFNCILLYHPHMIIKRLTARLKQSQKGNWGKHNKNINRLILWLPTEAQQPCVYRRRLAEGKSRGFLSARDIYGTAHYNHFDRPCHGDGVSGRLNSPFQFMITEQIAFGRLFNCTTVEEDARSVNPRTSGYPCDSKTSVSSSSYYYLRLRPDNRNESFFMFFFSLLHSRREKTINIVGDRIMLNVVVGGARRRRRMRVKKKRFHSTCANMTAANFFLSLVLLPRLYGIPSWQKMENHTPASVRWT